MNFFTEIERINDAIDPEHPTDADWLAIAKACRWKAVNLSGNWRDGTEVKTPASEPKAHSHFFANYGTDRIRKAVETYTREYRGLFEFAREMKFEQRENGKLTAKQAAGMLNVAIADAKKRAKRTGDLPAELAA